LTSAACRDQGGGSWRWLAAAIDR